MMMPLGLFSTIRAILIKIAGCRLKTDNFNDLSFDQVPLLWK